MTLTSCHFVLPVDGDGAPPWVQLVPAGTFSGSDGRGPYKVANAQALIAASLPAGARLAIDENHATDLAAPRGEAAPARGWIVELQARADGIWGRVEWNESGRALLADKAYRGISPVFETDKAGIVRRLVRAALTNNPNLIQLATLHQQGRTMDLATLRTHLGLASDADEAAILAAAERFATERTAHAVEIAGLRTQLQTAVAPELVTQLQAQITELRNEGARTRAVAFVDGMIAAGKPIAPLRDHYVARHMADAAGVETELKKLPSLHSGGAGPTIVTLHDAGDGDMLTETESAICRTMGLDPKKFKAHQKKMKEGG